MNISGHPEGCQCQPCKYAAAKLEQELEQETAALIAALGPGELSYIPKLENFPYLSAIELQRWKDHSEDLAGFLRLFGIELVPVGTMWKLCMLDERIAKPGGLH
jgi:hypothetical protein